MTYGFNDDKSKAEIYSKNDFKILSGFVAPAGEEIGMYKWNQEQLAANGINDICEWMPLSIMWGIANEARTDFAGSGIVGFINDMSDAFPKVGIQGSPRSLSISIYNRNLWRTVYFFKVILLKIK